MARKEEKVGQQEELAAQLLAAKRLLAIRRASEGLLDFAQLMMPDPADPADIERSRYQIAPHHRVIAEALEKVERGEILRLAISMPPRHGKSELATRLFPAWFMGKDPYRQTIAVGYSQTFAENEFGAKIRRIINETAYRQVFPGAGLSGGSKAVSNLVFKEGGNIASVGRGGAVTGRGADLLLIDDPLKDREEADSALIRDKLWDWFTSTAYTRLMPGGRVVVIQTRWHEDDLIGRLCDPNHPNYDAERASEWVYLNLPAIFESEDSGVAQALGKKVGDALWPERYPVSFLESVKRQSKRDFYALYQGRPYPDDGDFFKRADFVGYEAHELPKNLRKYGASDHALTEKQENDATCLGCVGIDEDDTIWILPDIFWDRVETDETVEAMLEQMRRHKPLTWWAENEHILKGFGPFLRKRMNEEKVYCVIDPRTPSKDKKNRARPIQGRMQMRKVRFPKFASWWPAAEAELLKFPNGTHDDFVDWLAHIGAGLDQEIPASREGERKVVPMTGTWGWFKERQNAERRDAKIIKMKKGF